MSEIYQAWVVWFLELIQMYLISRLIFVQNRTIKRSRNMIAFGVFIISLLLVIPFVDFSPVILLLASGIIFGIVLDGRMTHRILIFFCSYWMMNLIVYISIGIWGFVEGKTYFVCKEETLGRIAGNVGGIILIIIVGVWVQKIHDWREIWSNLRDLYYGAIACGGLFMSVFEVAAFKYAEQYSGYVLPNIVVIGVSGAFIAGYFAILSVFILNSQRVYYRRESQLKDEMIQLSKNYCSELLENENEIRKIRHDIKHHLNAISYYLENKKYVELQQYIKEAEAPMEQLLFRRVITRNELLDALLTRYIQREQQIEFHVEGIFDYKEISDFDLCTLFSNALTNAIEACKKLKCTAKEVELNIQKKQGSYVITISNPIEEEMNIHGLKTSKADKKNHGYGTKRMEEIVQKYGGTLVFDVEQNRFGVIITFPDISDVEIKK